MVSWRPDGARSGRDEALEEIRGNIRAAGLEPVERDGRFERIGGGTGE